MRHSDQIIPTRRDRLAAATGLSPVVVVREERSAHRTHASRGLRRLRHVNGRSRDSHRVAHIKPKGRRDRGLSG
jgi:hypothetical protein